MVFNLGIFARKPKAYNKTLYLTKIIIIIIYYMRTYINKYIT